MASDAVLYEMVLRGVAIGALAATILGWLRGGASRDARIAGLLFLISITGYALNTAPALAASGGHVLPVIMLTSCGPGALWLLCMVLFEDRRVSLPNLAPTLFLLADNLVAMAVPRRLGEPIWVFGNVFGALLCLHILIVLIRGWRGDLVEARRRLRGPLMAVVAVYTGLVSLGAVGRGVAGSFGGAVILAALTLTGAAVFLQGAASLLPPRRRQPTSGPTDTGLKAQDRLALERLNTLMETGEAWRREGLTIGDVAREVSLPEHRVRRLINDQLGHRNFAAFLNARRIEAAKALLTGDASTAISTLAFDLGYASLGPFNRAFKEATGVTPSEYRRRGPEPSSQNN